MNIKNLVNIIKNLEAGEFFTGVPDSQLCSLCDYLMINYGISKSHIIAANEGNATALAAGYYLATGKIPVVYLQNSGIGNIINPVSSLLNDKVYGIPCIFIIGWRGEPNLKDEPQHIFQGEITIKLLEDINIKTIIIDKETTELDLNKRNNEIKKYLSEGNSIAFIIKKGALLCNDKVSYNNDNNMLREDIIEEISNASGEDIIVSTTGKASRELFEIREKNKQSHKYDFLTVGSMGHSSSIALGLALYKPKSRIWCIDGDGAALMHMGAMAVIGSNSPNNLVHIVINNSAHETVGGMPTVSKDINFLKIAEGCGYHNLYSVSDPNDLQKVLNEVKYTDSLCFVEIKASLGSRADLGRPTTTAKDNKEIFMQYLKELE